MRFTSFLTAAWLGLLTGNVQAIDYGQIDRVRIQEPDYRADMPEYALLLFGPAAELRVWVVLDRDTLYVDRNGDGDLTAADERIGTLKDCRDIRVQDGGKPSRYAISSASTFEAEQAGTTERFLLIHVQISGELSYHQYAGVALRRSPAESHVAHYDGPLRIYPGSNDGRPGPEHVLRSGDDPAELDCVIGTIDPEFGCWTAVEVERDDKSVFPAGVFPWVDVEFPSRIPGRPPLRRSYPLSGFC